MNGIVDTTAAQRQAGRRPDGGAAVAAAKRVIADETGMHGTASLASDGSVQVTTAVEVDTVFLSLIGIRTVQGHGSATAQLFG